MSKANQVQGINNNDGETVTVIFMPTGRNRMYSVRKFGPSHMRISRCGSAHAVSSWGDKFGFQQNYHGSKYGVIR